MYIHMYSRQVDWSLPLDTGDLSNDAVPIIDYQIQFSNMSIFQPKHTRSASISLVCVRESA